MFDANRDQTERSADRRGARHPVVVAVGETGGVAALRAAHDASTRVGAEMVVVSVVEPPPAYTFETGRALLLPWLVEQQLGERRESVHARLHRIGFGSGGHAEPRVEVRYGDSADTIADVARETGARLVVLGIGPHSLRHRLLSSGTAWATGRRAPCPVLAVANDTRVPARVAVAATDFSPESIHALRAALPLLAEGAEVYVVHTWSRVEAAFPSLQLDALNDSYAVSLPGRFARLREALGSAGGVVFHEVVLEGRPAELVLSVARAKHADLVIAGTHGRNAIERWVLGSTSSALLRGAGCSVLLAPRPPLAERRALERHMSGTAAARQPQDWNAELRALALHDRDRDRRAPDEAR